MESKKKRLEAGLHFPLSTFNFPLNPRVTDGTRTRDNENHNLALYQLSYGHQRTAKLTRPAAGVSIEAANAYRPFRACSRPGRAANAVIDDAIAMVNRPDF